MQLIITSKKTKNMTFNVKRLKKYIVPAICVIVLLAVAFGLYYWEESKSKILKPRVAAEKSINFINQTYLQGQATAVLGQVSEEKGVYKIQFKIENQEYTAYTTKDGRLLFPSAIEMPDEVNGSVSTAGSNIPQRDVSQALLFVMSYCPYGNQAEEIMMPVINLLENKADIQLHYVIYSNYGGGGPNYCLDEDNKYCSMHGIQELHQDVRELCVQKYQKDKLWSFIKEANSKCTYQNVDSCWEGAAITAGVDIAEIKTCQRNEALALLEQEVQLNNKYGVTGSPQLIINDTEYKGSRSAEAYKTAICNGFNSAPSECSTELEDTGTSSTGGCE